MYFAIDPKGQRDLQCHMIFYITSQSYGLPISLWLISDLIQRKIRKISAIDVFPIIFDARGLRPDMLRFPRFSVWIYVFIQWRHSPSVNVITQAQGKRNMSGLSPLASNIIGKTSIETFMTSCPRDRKWQNFFYRNKRHCHFAFTKTSLISIWFQLTEIFQFKYTDDVIPPKPEALFLTTIVGNLKWRGQDLAELWMDISIDNERIYIELAIDPKVKVTFKVTWYFMWP